MLMAVAVRVVVGVPWPDPEATITKTETSETEALGIPDRHGQTDQPAQERGETPQDAVSATEEAHRARREGPRSAHSSRSPRRTPLRRPQGPPAKKRQKSSNARRRLDEHAVVAVATTRTRVGPRRSGAAAVWPAVRVIDTIDVFQEKDVLP